MLFNSLAFLLFFPIVTILYFLLPQTSYRRILLLIASCGFYMFFKPVYILILFFTILIDYAAGLWIEKSPDKKIKKRFLIASIISNVGVLAFFKYYNFFAFNIDGFANYFGFTSPISLLNIILPIGLSFHTFQAMSYTIEVYRGNQQAEKNIWTYALYVMYYPQLVAGPIERPQNLIHQFYEKKLFDYDRVVSGLKQMMRGFFKKMVVADRLGLFTNTVFSNVHAYHGFPLMWASLFFTIQIYCDFSGYSDIAIGASRVIGIDLMRNFNRPFISTSIREFWSRWHISLSTWFRDYVYIPLGGNKINSLRTILNIAIVFLLSGLWHGASWNFLVWGALHASMIIAGITSQPFQKKINQFFSLLRISSLLNFFNWGITFFLIVITFVVFRLTNFQDIIYVFKNYSVIDSHTIFGVPIFNSMFNIINVMLIVLILILEFNAENKFISKPAFMTESVYNYFYFAIVLTAIYMLGIFEQQSFIYFQF